MDRAVLVLALGHFVAGCILVAFANDGYAGGANLVASVVFGLIGFSGVSNVHRG